MRAGVLSVRRVRRFSDDRPKPWWLLLLCVALAMGHQHLCKGSMAFLRGDIERSLALVVGGCGLRAFFEQKITQSNVAFDSGEHKQRPAVGVGEVRGKAAVEGRAKAFFVATFDEGLC